MAERQHASRDAVGTRIGQAVMLHRGGDREEARNRLRQLWEDLGAKGDGFHRCAIAHYLAGTQDAPADALEWDRRALAAADALTRERAERGEHTVVAGALYPSLYLRLATDHARLGDAVAARRELARAWQAARKLADDAHGAGVRSAILRLELRLQGRQN